MLSYNSRKPKRGDTQRRNHYALWVKLTGERQRAKPNEARTVQTVFGNQCKAESTSTCPRSFHLHLLRIRNVAILFLIIRKLRYLFVRNRTRSSFPSSPQSPLYCSFSFDRLRTSSVVSWIRSRRRSGNDGFGSLDCRAIIEVFGWRRRWRRFPIRPGCTI